MAPSTPHPRLAESLHSLVVPTAFKKYENASEEEQSVLDVWAKRAVPHLREVLKEIRETRGEEIAVDELGSIIASVAPFIYSPASLHDSGERRAYEEERIVLHNETLWITTDAKLISEQILESLQVDEKVVIYVLDSIVKPVFRASNPHPHINPSTGKSLPQSQINRAPQQGGVASVTQDFFEGEGQRWKKSVGLEAVLYWCIDHIKPDVYDSAWHLVIPPLMTLLDDYQPRYKLWGLLIAQRMLEDVPSNLLKKTGIHGLLETSFKKLLAHQDSPLSPTILRLAISQSLRLGILTTPEGSKARFDTLCSLLGEGIITSVWTYTFDKPGVVRATLDALPPLIKTLDIGCARFLQSLMPQLIHPLVLPSDRGPIPGVPFIDILQLQLQLASLKVLITLMGVCAPRVHGWRLTILDAIVRCWAVAAGSVDVVEGVSPYSFLVPVEQRDSDDEDENQEPAIAASSMIDKCIADAQTVCPADPSDVKENLTCLKNLLQLASYQLVQICPSLATNEYPLLVQADSSLLTALLPSVERSVSSGS